MAGSEAVVRAEEVTQLVLLGWALIAGMLFLATVDVMGWTMLKQKNILASVLLLSFFLVPNVIVAFLCPPTGPLMLFIELPFLAGFAGFIQALEPQKSF